ncbi:hypothetical protein [Prescottella sp. R16]|uniref:hypothetical protein n=1 Tax=Prescottella sp. R16 TaxID=3064529 RepID=UPI00272ED1BF|nr:hypothetical protein [Prescottella sp. R16]
MSADDYYLGYGKHAFRLESGVGGCWFNPNASTPGPHMSCSVKLVDQTPIVDPSTGVRAPANAVVLDPDGARKVVNVAGGLTAGPVLPAGATLTVGELECATTPSGAVLECSGPAGSFRYDGVAGEVEIVSNGAPETAAPKLSGVGDRCGTVMGRTALPVVVLDGAVDCEAALAIADRYLNDPTVEAQGQGRYAKIDGWMCMWPYVPGRSHADSYLQCDDDPMHPQASFRIGD